VSLSKNQVDRLGDKLRKQVFPIPDADLRLLDEYRRSFGEPYEAMINRIRALQIEVSGRPSKTVPSIKEKLLREKIRLSEMQDIAGCRIVVNDIAEQENTLAILQVKLGKFSYALDCGICCRAISHVGLHRLHGIAPSSRSVTHRGTAPTN
jgi:putative GTP pyrophosphokinase